MSNENENKDIGQTGTVRMHTGTYELDPTAWFDLRLTDIGVVLSLCDADMNIRYTVVIDNGKVILREVDKLIRDEELRAMRDLVLPGDEPQSQSCTSVEGEEEPPCETGE